MKKGLFTLIALVLTLSAVIALTFIVSADDTVENFEVKAYYGKIEASGTNPYFIAGIVSQDNATLFANLKDGTYSLKVYVIDETVDKTYVIEKYAFDWAGHEFYATSFLRLGSANYGIKVESGHKYTLKLDVTNSSTGALVAVGTSGTGIFTGSVTGTVSNPTHQSVQLDGRVFDSNAIALKVKPVFGEVENWSGKTYFIVDTGFGSNPGDHNVDDFYAKIANGTYDLEVMITDETNNKTYIIDQYAFDAGNEIYSGWFFRLAVCEYGITPVLGNKYTVRLNVYDNGVLAYQGTSDVGAFDAYNEAFTADGAIVPDTVPHTSEVVEGGFPYRPVVNTLNIGAYYGKIENWSGKTYAIAGMGSSDSNWIKGIYDGLDSKKYALTVTVVDETALETFVIPVYAFDAGGEFYKYSFLRLALCEYGITPVADHAYTVGLTVSFNGTIVAEGVSARGAFVSSHDLFLADGAIIPSTVPHESESTKGVVLGDVEAVVGDYAFSSYEEAIAFAEAEAVVGKINTDDIEAVAIVKDGTYTVTTDTAVAVVAAGDNVVIEYAADVRELATQTVEVEGESYTAYVVAAKDYAVAVVGEDVYTTIDSAIAAAEASTVDGVKNNPVIILAEGEVVVTTNKIVAVVPYDDAVTTISYNTNEYVSVEAEVEYEGDTYTAYAIINTETFAQAMVGDTFYATVAEAIAAAEASTIDGVKNSPVIVLKSGTVAIDTAKAVAVVAFDEGRTSFVFDAGKYFTYEVQVEYEGETRTAYAVLNAVDFCQAIVGDTMYADLADAIDAAKGTFTPVIVFKPGNVNVEVDSFVLLGAVDSTATTILPGDNLSYETEVEYEGETYTAYAVYNHNYIFANVADKITETVAQAEATYVDGALTIALSTTDLTTLVGTEVFEAIVGELAPLFVLSEEAFIEDVTIYENDQLIVSNIFKVFNALGINLETIANLETKELTSFDIVITGATTGVTVPVSITLDITDAQFESLKTNAAKADVYVDYTISDNGEIVLVVDARPVVDMIIEKEIAKGKTLKEVRELLNGSTLRELADKLEGYGFTGAKAQAVKVFGKIIDKLATTGYASNLDSTLAMLDTDADGVYVVDKAISVTFGEKINKIVEEFKANNPEIADYINVENIVDVDTITITVDATVTVFDTYTVIFVDVDGNEIYSETLLEGEIPAYVGVAPEKATTDEYTYVFLGWTDGETTFEGELAELTKDVTYAPVFEEIALNGLDENLKFELGSVTFQDSFAINMAANKAVFEGYTTWYVIATLADGTEEVLYGVENGSYYKFTLNSISAKEVADVTSFVIYAEKEVNGVLVTAYGNAKEYCIKQYALNKINNEDTSDALKTLCVDTLVYAAHAQIKFSYNTANLATKGLTGEQFALGTQGEPVLENSFSYENRENELVHFHQATLVYESNIAIKFYLNLKEYAPEDVYVKVVYDDGASELIVSGEELVENGNFYTFEFSEYSAAELRREVVATVYDAATDTVISGPLTYGAEAYAYRQVAAGKDVDLVNAMMNYAISAEAVFNA